MYMYSLPSDSPYYSLLHSVNALSAGEITPFVSVRVSDAKKYDYDNDGFL